MALVPPQAYRKTAFTHRRGLFSAKPLATDVLDGTLYFSTDKQIIERSNGTTWESFSNSQIIPSGMMMGLDDVGEQDIMQLPYADPDAAYKSRNNAFTGSNSFANNALNLLVGQIQFPSTMNAASGANVLDDYEEGNWTPTIAGDAGTSGQTYSSQSGIYTKIGSLVVALYSVILTNKGTISGDVIITGLPFSVGTAGVMQRNPHMMRWGDLNTAYIQIIGVLIENNSDIFPRGLTAASSGGGAALTTADILNNSSFYGAAIYRTSI